MTTDPVQQTKAPKFFKRSKPRQFRRLRILIAGCGQVGLRLISERPTQHFTATCRDLATKANPIRKLGATTIQADLNNKADLRRLCKLSHRIIWMAPPNPQAVRDTSLLKASLYLGLYQYSTAKPVITYISTTGVYGNAEGQWISERSTVHPQSDRAKRRVNQETQLKHAAKSNRCAAHILRAPGIYGETRLPIDRIRNRTPALLAEEDSWSNHIHEVDLARLAHWCQFKGGHWTVVNACDSNPSRMGDYFDAVADHFRLERPPRVSRAVAKEQVSPMMWSFMSESRRIKSMKLNELGFRLRYPSVESFLKQLTTRQENNLARF